MTLKYIRIIAFLCTLPLALDACGKKKDKDDEGGGESGFPLTGTDLFLGEWEGQYIAINDGKLYGSPSKVHVTFSDEMKFAIQMAEDTTAFTKGTWQEFGGKQLFLAVTDSTLSRIGLAKANLNVSYETRGKNDLIINNTDFQLSIKRIVNTGPAGGSTSPTGIAGIWNCNGSGRNTEINISADYHWRATVKSDGSGMLLMSGSGRPGTDGSYVLTVESSQPQVKAGSSLIFTQRGTQTFLSTLSPTAVKESLGDCHRG